MTENNPYEGTLPEHWPKEVYVMGHRMGINPMAPIEYGSFGIKGLFEYGHEQSIGLASDLSEEHARETLLHEIVHAIDFMLREPMNLKWRRERQAQLSEWLLLEGEVKVVSVGLFQVMTDPRNHQVRDWIFYGTKP